MSESDIETPAPDTLIMPEAEDGRIGLSIGNLQLCARLGVGGMGAVYLAKHRLLESSYAVKVLHPRFSEDPNEVARFKTEAIATARLRHENIVFVTDFGFDEQLGLYLVMEHLDGLSLFDVLTEQGTVTLGRSIHIIRQVAAAMNIAHGIDISHRDLKPENIVLISNPGSRDHVKVLDFGIAALKDDEHNHSAKNIIGTPAYMAPEQISTEAQNKPHLIDIYALGMLLYRMIIGQTAFLGNDLNDLLKAQLWEPAPLVSSTFPELAGTLLERLIEDSLKKHPSDRPKSASVFIERLDAAQAELEEKDIAGIYYSNLVEEDNNSIFDADTTILPAENSSTIRMTSVIRQIRTVSPSSAAGMLLDAIPMLETLRGEALCGALWGVIQQELLIHELHEPEFQIGCDQLVLLLQAVLESNLQDTKTPSQIKIFKVLRSTLPTLGDPKRQRVMSALSSLSAHPHYPHDWLSYTGSWDSFKKIMTTEIHLPWSRRNPNQLNMPMQSDSELAKMSLMEKLNQEVSFRNIGAVLNHEIKIFGNNIEEDD